MSTKVKVTSLIWKDKRVILLAISSFTFSVGLIFEFVLKLSLLARILFLVTAVASGYGIAKKGLFYLIFKKRLNIDSLITIAAMGSFLIGHGEEGAAVILLFCVAEFLEEQASERAKSAVISLMKLAPEVVSVKKNGKETRISVHDVNIGDIVVVRPGEKIPVDGKVIRGISSVNQAPITGESMPVTKQVDDEVYAGTINNEGFLEIMVTKRSDETMISKIIY